MGFNMQTLNRTHLRLPSFQRLPFPLPGFLGSIPPNFFERGGVSNQEEHFALRPSWFHVRGLPWSSKGTGLLRCCQLFRNDTDMMIGCEIIGSLWFPRGGSLAPNIIQVVLAIHSEERMLEFKDLPGTH